MDPDGNDVESFFVKIRNLYNLRVTVDQIVTGAKESGSRFVLSEQTIRSLHRVCMTGLLDDAGEYRKKAVGLSNGLHIPPNWTEVKALMGSFCEFVNLEWEHRDLVWLAAFCLWRLNWIHPFTNGNGRTARELAYLVLCARHGQLLPPKDSIIEQITANKQPFEQALQQTDKLYAATNDFDKSLAPMVHLVGTLLTRQLQANL